MERELDWLRVKPNTTVGVASTCTPMNGMFDLLSPMDTKVWRGVLLDWSVRLNFELPTAGEPPGLGNSANQWLACALVWP